jgi:hypothetical protein
MLVEVSFGLAVSTPFSTSSGALLWPLFPSPLLALPASPPLFFVFIVVRQVRPQRVLTVDDASIGTEPAGVVSPDGRLRD